MKLKPERQLYMRRDHLNAWLEALRSGEYEQGFNALSVRKAYDKLGNYDPSNLDNPRSYCCLGVWCEIAKSYGVSNTQNSDGTLPSEEAIPLWGDGIQVNPIFNNQDNPVMDSPGLAQVNDEFKWSFDAIADLLEQSITPVNEIPDIIATRISPHLLNRLE